MMKFTIQRSLQIHDANFNLTTISYKAIKKRLGSLFLSAYDRKQLPLVERLIEADVKTITVLQKGL